jgi:hypothetical protein
MYGEIPHTAEQIETSSFCISVSASQEVMLYFILRAYAKTHRSDLLSRAENMQSWISESARGE